MYKKKAHIHFVGIGGIGMSGIAKILTQQGYVISGCDQDIHQQSIYALQTLGCKIYEGNNNRHCADASIGTVVYSSAINFNNPEILAAQKRGIPTITRAIMLAELMRTKYSIAVAGAHGKTTTTSLISHILIQAQKDPTVIIGGHVKNIGTNANCGMSDFLVAEADESDRSIRHLHPTLALVTNIDLEHLDVYKDIDDIKNTFKQFLYNIPFYGKAILCIEDQNIQSLLPLADLNIITYGLHKKADVYAKNIVLQSDFSVFSVYRKNVQKALTTICLPMPGRHNILNALGAITIALDLEIPVETITQALATFKGIERRFTFKGVYQGAEIFDDYGHHPEEIKNTLIVAKKRSKGRLIVIFQPHRYSRTFKLWDLFLETFCKSSINELIITDIYPASEHPIPEITSQNFVAALKKKNPDFNVSYVPFEYDFHELKNKIDSCIQKKRSPPFAGGGKNQ